MVVLPVSLGADLQTLTTEQIRKYDTEVTEILGGANMLAWRQALGTNYNYNPGQHDFQFKYFVYPFATNGISKYGAEANRVTVGTASLTQGIVAIRHDIEEIYKDIQSWQQGQQGKIDILAENIQAAAFEINWEEDYYLYNGKTDLQLNGIQSGDGTTPITDLGNPTGAWDDPTDVFADFPGGPRRLRRYGFLGPITVITDPYLFSQAFIGRMLDDGTNYYDASLLNFSLEMMGEGGRFVLTPFPFVTPVSNQATGRAIPEITAGANHYMVWICQSPFNHVAIAEDVRGFDLPSPEGDFARMYREFVSVKMGQPRALCYMDAIDETS